MVSYPYRIVEKEAASAAYDAAGLKLELSKIKMRLAEIHDQHEPLASMIPHEINTPEYNKAREDLYAAAYYVVVGRPYRESNK